MGGDAVGIVKGPSANFALWIREVCIHFDQTQRPWGTMRAPLCLAMLTPQIRVGQTIAGWGPGLHPGQEKETWMTGEIR